mmetsp:Transcript_43758/g.81837  ORF Transcript_43758/g.81837 Transcript_43758/m.81837 type:complete len:231 (+) Transcript_43758:1682-2374(+)
MVTMGLKATAMRTAYDCSSSTRYWPARRCCKSFSTLFPPVSSVLSSVAVRRPRMPIPTTMRNTVMQRATMVCGTMSPYPTVVMVTTVNHTTSGKDRNRSWWDCSRILMAAEASSTMTHISSSRNTVGRLIISSIKTLCCMNRRYRRTTRKILRMRATRMRRTTWRKRVRTRKESAPTPVTPGTSVNRARQSVQFLRRKPSTPGVLARSRRCARTARSTKNSTVMKKSTHM